MDSSASPVKLSPLDLMTAFIRGGKVDLANVSSNSGASSAAEFATLILDNREFVMILTTSIVVLIGCAFVLVWRRSSSNKPKLPVPLKPLILKNTESEEDAGKTKVVVFSGTQTGTAEGFAKAFAEEAKTRYEKSHLQNR